MTPPLLRSPWPMRAGLIALAAICALFLAPVLAPAAPPVPAQAARALPPPALNPPAASTGKLETAIVSGGCFWGVQGVFQHVKGVAQAVSGYDGGTRATAAYEIVSSGATNHAESVKIVFDPKQISYGEILRIFFSVATDPTQVNQQFPDHGRQYRSQIWTTTPAQKRIAEAYIAQLNAARALPRPIATRVEPDRGFYRAEAHHQDYLTLHPNSFYIATFDMPKIEALKAAFPSAYRDKPVRTAAGS